eukprot:TRINITY_DN1038_c0_g1_i4.p1 TRINITY_DN1038_c0_g1~~TRINITY_DN1038_c0_g1_i4.p1  ORF type:complete len:309 (+),score=93.10 TRINITY_DN1038_c0_g1_i4:152-1078(+)
METLCGVEAEAIYEVCVEDEHPNNQLTIKLGVPAIGRNSAKVTGPAYIQWAVDKGKGDKCITTIELSSVHESAFQDLRNKELLTDPDMQRRARILQQNQQSQLARAARRQQDDSHIPVVMGIPVSGVPAQETQAAPPPPRLSKADLEDRVASITGLAGILPEVHQAAAGQPDETLDIMLADLKARLGQLPSLLSMCAEDETLMAALLDANDIGTAAHAAYSPGGSGQPADSSLPSTAELEVAPADSVEPQPQEPEAQPNSAQLGDNMLAEFDELMMNVSAQHQEPSAVPGIAPAPPAPIISKAPSDQI